MKRRFIAVNLGDFQGWFLHQTFTAASHHDDILYMM